MKKLLVTLTIATGVLVGFTIAGHSLVVSQATASRAAYVTEDHSAAAEKSAEMSSVKVHGNRTPQSATSNSKKKVIRSASVAPVNTTKATTTKPASRPVQKVAKSTSAPSRPAQPNKPAVVPQRSSAAKAQSASVPAPSRPAPKVSPTRPAPAPAYQAHALYINGRAIPYIQGNMSMAAAPAATAATWGGQTRYSNTSGQNTHFIGHNPGVFSGLLGLGIGSRIIVTDAAGTPRTYTVNRITQVDDHARTASGEDLWQLITSTSGGQRITLQTCLSDTRNLIVFAA